MTASSVYNAVEAREAILQHHGASEMQMSTMELVGHGACSVWINRLSDALIEIERLKKAVVERRETLESAADFHEDQAMILARVAETSGLSEDIRTRSAHDAKHHAEMAMAIREQMK